MRVGLLLSLLEVFLLLLLQEATEVSLLLVAFSRKEEGPQQMVASFRMGKYQKVAWSLEAWPQVRKA